MSGPADKLLDYAVWQGGKWYVRHRYLNRLPSARAVAAAGLAAATAGAVVATLARRTPS
ncbi:MAG TPA: hypothetical protein VFC30_04195 [Solirubrobacteraceae bacterium]|nr:hypothetical protein [Solirubrobacteraceae bacterium]